MTYEVLAKIKERAKKKDDGVYAYKNNFYLVKDGQVKRVTEGREIYEIFGAFVVKVGEGRDKKELIKGLRGGRDERNCKKANHKRLMGDKEKIFK